MAVFRLPFKLPHIALKVWTVTRVRIGHSGEGMSCLRLPVAGRPPLPCVSQVRERFPARYHPARSTCIVRSMRQLSNTLLVAAAMLLLVACGEGAAAPSVDIEATVEARVKERLAAIPTPTARVVEKEVVKEVVVEKIVVVTATPTPMPTATPTPTPAPTPMPTATPTPTPLDAFDGTIHITSQTGVMVHEVKWSLINNSRQEVTLVSTEIYNDSGLMVGALVSGESPLAAGQDRNINTTFMNTTEEQLMTYQFVWTFRMHTGETIVCTFSITNPKSCLRSLID